ncbi:MAG: hypothetical protein IKE30_06310 [Clostridia bacterium]|nr:hypothetical protein [Clostridia bacterium]
MPQDAETVHINTDLIPPWVAEYLTEQLYRSVRNFFSVPENQAKFEKWKAERDQRREAAQKGK